MCDASEVALDAVLGQRKDKLFHPMYYVSKSLNVAQQNFTMTEQELLVVVYAFRSSEPIFWAPKSIIRIMQRTII